MHNAITMFKKGHKIMSKTETISVEQDTVDKQLVSLIDKNIVTKHIIKDKTNKVHYGKLKRQVRDKRMATGINPNIMNQTQPEGLRNAISKENSYDPNRHNGSFKFKVRQGAHAKNYKACK